MSERRRTDPTAIQHIWDAIKFIVHQRTLPSEGRVRRHVARMYGKSEQSVQEDLNNAVKDGLVQMKKVANKNGVEQESYRIPVELTDADEHDWYCCKCQRAGVVECCQKCHRVFHKECHSPESPDLKYCNFCEVCLLVEFTIYCNLSLYQQVRFGCAEKLISLQPLVDYMRNNLIMSFFNYEMIV